MLVSLYWFVRSIAVVALGNAAGRSHKKCLTWRRASAIMVWSIIRRKRYVLSQLDSFSSEIERRMQQALSLSISAVSPSQPVSSRAPGDLGGAYIGGWFIHGQFPEWPNGTDCKSVVGRLRGFESLTAHRTSAICPCGAAVAHSLGKTGVMGSIPITGSRGICGI